MSPLFRRGAVAAALSVLIVFSFATAALAAKGTRSTSGGTSALSWSTSSRELQNPVEQWTPGWLMACPAGEPDCRNDSSLWVRNNTGCTWDVDDHWLRSTSGASLAAGATAVDSLCNIADCDGGQCGPYRYVLLSLYAPTPDLAIKLSFDPGQSYNATSAWDSTSRLWHYTVCAQPPVYDYGDSRLQDIPDSNGGRGVPTNVSLSVTNAGSKSISKISGDWGIDQAVRGAHC